ncbi:MAG: D-alanine--D-alanine ligase [Flammeovirgaceae bacterium]|nr:D-alanine--D-alanine ligase [Flammeovirgaceae bacterium]
MTKLKVAILYGGKSVEHGVSVNSARNIATFIDKTLYDVLTIGITTKGSWFLTSEVSKDIDSGKSVNLMLDHEKPGFQTADGEMHSPDVIFPVLHGTDGEDGSIQGLIKAINVPMIGTGVLGSAVSMNKLVAKQLMRQANIPIADFLYSFYSEKENINFKKIKERLGLPFMVKSTSLGSSVGITKVNKEEDFNAAVNEALRYDDCVLFEKFIQGREIECAVLGNQPPEASNPGELVLNPNYEFYTFDAKYVDPDAVKIEIPARIDNPTREKIRSLSVKCFQVLHCQDFARVDLFLTSGGDIYINEINTIPGFTNSSMYPMMWKEKGISFSNLISKLIELAMKRFEQAKRLSTDYQSSLKY